MAKKRPTSVLVLAILHLLGGTFGLLLTTCSGLGLVVQANRAAARPAQAGAAHAPESAGELGAALQAYIQEKVPGVQAVNAASVGVSLVFDLMLLAAGVGLLLMQPWARVLSLVYAFLSILQKLFYLAFQLALVYP